MQVEKTLTTDLIDGAVALLGRHVPELTASTLVAAIRAYACQPQLQHNHETEKPMTRKQAGEFLQVSLPTLDALIKSGKIQAVKVGRGIRIDANSVRKIIGGGKNL